MPSLLKGMRAALLNLATLLLLLDLVLLIYGVFARYLLGKLRRSGWTNWPATSSSAQ